MYYWREARDSLLEDMGFGNTTDPCVNSWNSTCDTATINDFLIQSPELIPICFMAAVIGLHGFFTLRKFENVRGSKIYSWTFLLFGIMMSDAAWNDCILAVHGSQQDFVHLFFGILDVGLTSSIGLTWGFNGLVDVGLLKEGTTLWVILGICYTALFGSWYYVFTHSIWGGFVYLYVFVIAIGCGTYCITELIYLFTSGNRKGFLWVFVAGLTGGVGLGAIYFPGLDHFLCHTFGCHFGGNTLWFFLSDVAMYAAFRYFLSRTESSPQNNGYSAVPTYELQSVN